MKNNPLDTLLSSSGWKQALKETLVDNYEMWIKNDPRWLEHIDHILDHLEIARARKIILKSYDIATLFSVAAPLDAAVLLRFLTKQTMEEKENEKMFLDNERRKFQGRRARANRLRIAMEEIETEFSSKPVIADPFGKLLEARDAGQGNPMKYNKDILELFGSKGWRTIEEHYFNVHEDEVSGYQGRPTRHSVLGSIRKYLRQGAFLDGTALDEVSGLIMNAAVGTKEVIWNIERVRIEVTRHGLD